MSAICGASRRSSSRRTSELAISSVPKLRLKAICERHEVPLRAAALQFPQRHPAVRSVLIGSRSPEEVRDCVEMAGLPIPDELWAEV